MGFLHVVHDGLITEMGLELDQGGNVAAKNFHASQPWVFAAGDTINGTSLVVRAIDSGRAAAAAIDKWLNH
jgi:glutamate synthase (NADPH/NADH) small chain